MQCVAMEKSQMAGQSGGVKRHCARFGKSSVNLKSIIIARFGLKPNRSKTKFPYFFNNPKNTKKIQQKSQNLNIYFSFKLKLRGGGIRMLFVF